MARGWITYAILLAVSIVLLALVMAEIWQPLLIAAVLAGALQGLHERLAMKLRHRRTLSAALMTFGVIVLILLPLTVLTVIAVRQMLVAIPLIRDALRAGGIENLISKLPSPADEWAAELFAMLQGNGAGVDQLASGGRAAAAVVTGALSKTTNGLISLVLMLIAFHFLLRDGHRLVAWIERNVPLRVGQTHELLVEFRVVAKTVLGSTLVTAAAQGALATVGYAIAGVPQVVFFGLLTFFAAFVPSIGTAMVSLPLSGLLWLLGHPWAALFLLVWATVIVGLVDNLTKPLLMKGEMRLHGAIVFFSLVGGIFFFGAVGLIVGPLAIAFFLAMVRLGKRDYAQTAPRPVDSIR